MYIGKTKSQFRIKCKEYIADTRHNTNTPVANHMNACGFHNDDILDACIITKIQSNRDKQRNNGKQKINGGYKPSIHKSYMDLTWSSECWPPPLLITTP